MKVFNENRSIILFCKVVQLIKDATKISAFANEKEFLLKLSILILPVFGLLLALPTACFHSIRI